MLEHDANWERVVFPALSEGAAALSNCLIGRNMSFNATVMGDERRFSLVDATQEPSQNHQTFRCSIGGCGAFISMNDDQAHRLLPRLAADVAVSDLPEPLVMAIAVVGLRPILTGLSACLGAPFSLDEMDEDAAAGWPRLFLCEGEGPNSVPVAALHVDPAGLKPLALSITAAPPTLQWGGADSVLIKVKAQFWRTVMTAGEVADLACGDIVLLPEGYPADRVELIAGEGQVPIGAGRRKGSSITVEELKGTAMADQSEAQVMEVQPPNDETEMQEVPSEEEISDDEERDEDAHDAEDDEQLEGQDLDESADAVEAAQDADAAHHGGIVDSEKISIPIAFNLGHGLVSVADLRSLGPGYVFSLESESGAEVEIVAGGQGIGRGEIVQIADRLGIRIVELKGGSDA